MAAKHTLLPHASRNIWPKTDQQTGYFSHRNVWNPNMKSVFHMHWGNSLANTCDRNVLGDMSVVFSPPSWGCHSASLLINSPQDWPTDPRLHWPVNRQLASDWIINRMCYPQNSQWWAQSPRSNTFKTKRTPLYNWARRIHLNRCGYCRIKVELQLKYCTWCQFDTL